MFYVKNIEQPIRIKMLSFNNEIINNRCFNREIDEHIAPKIIRFGSFLFDAKKSKMKEGALDNTTSFETKFIFQGINLRKKDSKKTEKYIYIGSMIVDVT
jgi:hypothetical protein